MVLGVSCLKQIVELCLRSNIYWCWEKLLQFFIPIRVTNQMEIVTQLQPTWEIQDFIQGENIHIGQKKD